MTDLSDFLKVKKVRCVSIGGYNFITVGKIYEVVGVNIDSVVIVNDNEHEGVYPYRHFEPVLDSAENPLQKMELTSELEAVEPVLADNCEVNTQDNSVNTQDNSINIQATYVEPKFKVGDKAYYGNRRYLLEIIEIRGCMARVRNSNYLSDAHINYLCHATQENYERLQATFPDIEFEQPTKELTGSDLARAMLDKGWNLVPCVISQISDDEALLNDDVVFIDEWNGRQFEHGDKFCIFAVPFDPKTGEPLTEAVLDE